MNVSVSSGNMKLGKVMNVSLTPCATCPENAPCRSKCYAMKAFRMYPNVKAAWNNNTEAAKTDLASYFAEINKSVSKKKPEYFRWHVAGDIISQQYLQGMYLVARANPNTKFLAFTKNVLDYSNKPKNLEIVFSLWPNWGDKPAQLPVAFMQDGQEKRVDGTELVCPGKCKDCKACWHLSSLKKNVVFVAH